jgi:hypothetical protein
LGLLFCFPKQSSTDSVPVSLISWNHLVICLLVTPWCIPWGGGQTLTGHASKLHPGFSLRAGPLAPKVWARSCFQEKGQGLQAAILEHQGLFSKVSVQ